MADQPPGRDTDEGLTTDLEVAFEPDVGTSQASGGVLCFRGDDLLGEVGTNYTKPVVFKDVPMGDLRVVVVPHFGATAVGWAGELRPRLRPGPHNLVRVRLDQVTAEKVDVRMHGLPGQLLTDKTVTVYDVTHGRVWAWHNSFRAKTDEHGCLVFSGFPGRLYQIHVAVSLPPFVKFESPVVEVKKGKSNVLDWALAPGRIMKVRFFFMEPNGQRRPALQMKSINVLAGGVGTNIDVSDARLTLYRGVGFLKGAKQVRLMLSGREMMGWEIVENEEFELSDKDVQVVDVVLKKFGNSGGIRGTPP